MTPYELLELRAQFTNSVLGLFRFWISITFALLVAAQVVGPEMGLAGATAATILYLLSTGTSVLAIRRYGIVSEDIYIDMQNMVTENSAAPTVLVRATPTKSYVVAINMIVCIGSVSAIIYTYFRAGIIGA
jgi:hypothetical protein